MRSIYLTLRAPYQQSVYSIDIIAYDLGKPAPLQSRITMTFTLVDESNNAAQFNRMQICLSGRFQCEKDYASVLVRIKEEQAAKDVAFSLGLAKMNDATRRDADICYYLSGVDKKYFSIDKKSGIIQPRLRLDRELKDKYEVIVRASEYCSCAENKPAETQCKLLNLNNDTFELGDITQLRVKIFLDDINDHRPTFGKRVYQIGISDETNYGETILESEAQDLDSTSNLTFRLGIKYF